MDVKHGQMEYVSSVLKDITLTTKEYVVKFNLSVRFLTEIWVFVKAAIKDIELQMVFA
jgi:hypothetical protein